MGIRPGDGEVVKTLVRLYHHLRQPGKAVELLEGHLREFPLATDLTHVNILAELHMEAGRFAEALTAIQATGKGLSDDDELPIDLQVTCSPAIEGQSQPRHLALYFPIDMFLSTTNPAFLLDSRTLTLASNMSSYPPMQGPDTSSCQHWRC